MFLTPLVADGGDGTWQLILAALLGGGLAKGADYLLQYMGLRTARQEADRKARREDREDAMARMEKLLDRAEAQMAQDRAENSRLRESANRATVRAERAVLWIKHLESRLREHQIPFDEWDDRDDLRDPVDPPRPQGGVGTRPAFDPDTSTDGGYP